MIYLGLKASGVFVEQKLAEAKNARLLLPLVAKGKGNN